MRTLWNIIRFLCGTLFLAGAVIRVGMRDAIPYVSAFYYAAPWPLLVLLIIPEFVTHLFRRQWRRLLALGAICVTLLAVWLHDFYRYPSPITAESGNGHRAEEEPFRFRIVYWTADFFNYGSMAESASILSHYKPDLVVIIERDHDWGTQREVFGKYFPEHKIELLPFQTLLLHRGTIQKRTTHFLDGRNASLLYLQLLQNDRVMHLVVYDQRSNPFYSRKESFLELAGFMERFDLTDNLIILGDFNTPPDSLHFRSLRRNFSRAYELAGEGWQGTWPAGLPLLKLDQTWVGPSIRVERCIARSLSLQGHRALIIDLAIAPSAVIPKEPATEGAVNRHGHALTRPASASRQPLRPGNPLRLRSPGTARQVPLPPSGIGMTAVVRGG